MKGITPIIAVILLLLITVSMAGFAFIFLQRSLETTTTSTEQSLQEQMNQQRQKVIIDNVMTNTAYMRHTGTVTIDDINKVTVYVNNAKINCGGGEWVAPWTPGSIKACAATFTCNETTVIKVTSPGGQDSTTC